jgi:ADP-heptose:LPS heptosyltransferase
VVRRGYVGDIIQTTALVADLREEYPQAEIVYMTGPAGVEVLRDNPAVDRTVAYVEQPERGRGGLLALRSALRALRRERFDLGLCLSHNSWDAVLLRLIGVAHAAGFAEPGREFLLDQALTWDERELRPAQERYDELLRSLGVTPRCRTYYFPTEEDKEEVWTRLLPGVDPRPGFLMVIAPGGGRHPAGCAPYRQWPPERFAEVVSILSEEWQAEVCLIGDSEDAAVARRVLEAVGAGVRHHVHDLTGRTTLREVGALLTKARLLIANDSAPVWVAAAVGCPVLAIFGCNHPTNHRPLAAAYAAVSGSAPCHPCFSGAGVPACPLPPLCLEAVSVDDVTRRARGLLDRRQHVRMQHRLVQEGLL